MGTNQAALVAIVFTLFSSQASAHAFVRTASPAVGSVVSQQPRQVVIDFTEDVEPAFSSIVVQNASGVRVDDGNVHLAGGRTHLAVGLKPLPPGRYKVMWHATATDTHKTEGSYDFTAER